MQNALFSPSCAVTRALELSALIIALEGDFVGMFCFLPSYWKEKHTETTS